MTIDDVLQELCIEYGTAEFEYNEKKCGIEPEVKNSIVVYCMWYGNKWKDFTSIDELITYKFFDEKSLLDILPNININF